MAANPEKLPSKGEAEALVRGWIDNCLWRQEIHLAETGGIEYFDPHEIERMGEQEARELDGLGRYASNLFAPKQNAAIARALAGNEPIEPYRPIIESAAREIGVLADRGTVAGRLFERTILRGYATLLDELRETVAAIPRQPATVERKAPQPDTFVFTSFWEDFENHKLGVREWKSDTAENARGSRRIFDKAFPNVTAVQLIAEPIATNFKATLLQLPRHYARGESASTSIDQLTAHGRSLPPADRMQPGTCNKHLNALSEYWDYLVSQKKVHPDLANPFAGLHLAKAKGKKARDERHNWPKSLEQNLFESPLYRGCASIHRRATPGAEIHRDALFWMPLLARTMGARESELCDALVRNVCFEDTQEGKIAYLDLIEGKDSGSARNVPFAQLVVDMGFLEQRVYGRDPDQPLFPELIPQGPGKRRSAAFSDRFSYYRRAIKVYRPRVDFHSFRGNVETDLKNAGSAFSTAWIDELIGHESKFRRSEGERYTKAILLPILRRLVNSISIAADLSHLRYSGVRGSPAPGRDGELARFAALAEKEMKKKQR